MKATNMKLTKEQKDKIIADLSQLFGCAKLKCDGYDITLQVERFKGFKYRVMKYVNGTFDGKWISQSNGAPESKFLRKSTRPNLSPAKRLKAEKSMGKRYVSKHSFWSGSVTLFLPDWGTGRAAVNHLCKVCNSVELIESLDALGALRDAAGTLAPEPALAA